MPELATTTARPSPAQQPSEQQMANQLESGRARAMRSGGSDAKNDNKPAKGEKRTDTNKGTPSVKEQIKSDAKKGISSGLKSGFKSAFKEPGEVNGEASSDQDGDDEEGGSFTEKLAREGARKLGEQGGKIVAGAVGGAAYKKGADIAIAAKKILEEKSPEAVTREGLNWIKNYVLWPALSIDSLLEPTSALFGILVLLEVYWVSATIYKHKLTVPMAIWEHMLIFLFFLAQLAIILLLVYGGSIVYGMTECDSVVSIMAFPGLCAVKAVLPYLPTGAL